MTPSTAPTTREADARMIAAWASRDLGHVPDVSQDRADRLAAARRWVREALALPLAGALPSLPPPRSPQGR